MNLGSQDETLGFVQNVKNLDDGIKSICAMLNKQGYGCIYFGVDNNGIPKGINITEQVLCEISKKIIASISPQISPTINKRTIDDKDIVEIRFSGSNKPYSTKGLYLIREGSKDLLLKPHELRQLFEYSKDSSWDSLLTDYSVKDIDRECLDEFINRAISNQKIEDKKYQVNEFLKTYELIKNNRLTNACYLLFSNKNPITVRLSLFANDDQNTYLDFKRIKGNILTLISESILYVKRYIRWIPKKINGISTDIPEIPSSIIEELVANAFLHARYNSYFEHEIVITPSCIKITNPGEFPIGYSPDEMINNNENRMVRNPLICKTYNLIEKGNTSKGYVVIKNELNKSHLSCNFQLHNDSFEVIIQRNTTNIGVKNVVNNVVNKTIDKIDESILNLIKSDPYISAVKIGKVVKKSERSIQRKLKELKERGLIEHIGKTRGYWRVLD